MLDLGSSCEACQQTTFPTLRAYKYAQDTVGRPVHSLVQVGVIEDDDGALATELEGDLLQVRLRSRLHDLATDKCAACECDLLDVSPIRISHSGVPTL